MSDGVGAVDLVLLQGQTNTLRIGPYTDDQGVIFNFTGWTIFATGRRAFGINPPLWTRTSAAGNIVVSAWVDEAGVSHPAARLVITWGTDITVGLAALARPGVWDLEIQQATTPFTSRRLLQGSYRLSPEVTT